MFFHNSLPEFFIPVPALLPLLPVFGAYYFLAGAKND
jgi:hypothetical protein